MDKTLFAGLTRLDPGEPFSLDGYSFQAINPFVIDRLLKVGAKTHRHDARPGLDNPVEPPLGDLTTTGVLSADTNIVMGYTLVDADKGETTLAPTLSLTTDPPMDAPDMTPDYAIDSVGGHLVTGSYLYAITLTDPSGETTAGPSMAIDIDPGSDTNQITFTGLSDIVAATPGATGWRMYKATAVGRLTFIAAGGGTLDELTDDGTLCPDCTTEPPRASTTQVSQGMTFTVPNVGSNAQDAAVAFRIYAGIDGDFSTPSFVEERPITDLDVTITYESLVTEPGAPPDTNTSVGGAMKIDPDTELVDYHWKRPVIVPTLLPEPAEEGDVRVVLNDGSWWTYFSSAWRRVTMPAAYWQAPVPTLADLPTDANVEGDVRLVLTEAKLYFWLAGDPAGSWEVLTAAGDGGGGGGGGLTDGKLVLVAGGAGMISWQVDGVDVAVINAWQDKEMAVIRDDDFATDDDPAPDWYPESVKTEGGYLVPNSAFTGAEITTLQAPSSGPPPRNVYEVSCVAEALTNNWQVFQIVIGDGDRGIMMGYDKTDASSKQQGFRYRVSAGDSWTYVNQTSWTSLFWSIGYPIRLTMTLEEWPAYGGELRVTCQWYNVGSNVMEFQFNTGPITGLKDAFATAWDNDAPLLPGIRMSGASAADFRVDSMRSKTFGTYTTIGASVDGPAGWVDSVIATSRP